MSLYLKNNIMRGVKNRYCCDYRQHIPLQRKTRKEAVVFAVNPVRIQAVVMFN